MARRKGMISGLLALLVPMSMTAGCQSGPLPLGSGTVQVARTALPKGAVLSGRLLLPTRFTTRATTTDVATNAEILLMDGGVAKAAGLTAANGRFTLYPGPVPFTPVEGAYYILEARSRVVTAAGTDRPIVALRTLMQRQNGRWQSITGGQNVVINLTTSALVDLQTNPANGLTQAALMGKVTGGQYDQVDPGLAVDAQTLRDKISLLDDRLADSRNPFARDITFKFDDVYVRTQADLDRVQSAAIIDGTLYIEGNTLTSVTFPNLRRALNIRIRGASALQQVSFPLLHQVTGVGIDQSPGLTNLSGFGALTTVGTVEVTNCNGFQNLTGLGPLTAPLFVTLTNNPALTSLSGLTGSGKVAMLSLTNLPALGSLSGLAGKFGTQAYITIANCGAITSLQGLDLPAAMGALTLTNTGITSLAGLEGVHTIYPYLSNNAALTDISALSSMQSGQGVISGNSNLAEGCITDLQTALGNNALQNGGGNLTGALCPVGNVIINNQADLTAAQAITTVPGTVMITNSTLTNVALPNLQRATNIVVSGNAQLQTLSFPSLVQATNLTVTQNPALTDLTGFGQLTNLRSLTVSDSTGMQTLNGLGTIATGPLTVTVRNNPGLTSLTGLNQAPSMQALEVTDCSGLQSLSGIVPNPGVPLNLTLRNNHALTDLTGLGGVTNLRYLEVTDSNGLQSLNGMVVNPAQALTVMLRNNPSLMTLTGLGNAANLEWVDISDCNGLADLTGFGSHPNPVSLSLSNSWAMGSLAGVEAPTQIGALTLNNMQSLGGLDDLAGRFAANANVSLMNCWAVTSLSGLSGLTSMTSLYVDNGGIGDLSGLESLTSIQSLILTNNQNLYALNGLSSLQTLGNGWISDNYSLSGINALSGLQSGQIAFNNNYSLADGCISDLQTLLPNVSVQDMGTNMSGSPCF